MRRSTILVDKIFRIIKVIVFSDDSNNYRLAKQLELHFETPGMYYAFPQTFPQEFSWNKTFTSADY